MSTRYDILAAKEEYNRHLDQHKCGTLTGCPQRTELWQAWMGTAGLWGMEPDDSIRQRDQFRRAQSTAA